MKPRNGIIHTIFHPVGARRFVEPVVKGLIDAGLEAEIWVQRTKGAADSFLDDFQVPAKFCPSNLGFNPFKALQTFFALTFKLMKRRPIALHAHLFRGAFLPLLAGTVCRVPIRIYHNHGVSYVGYRGLLRRILMLIEGANCRLATHVATVNKSMRPALEKVAPKEKPIMVFGPGSACGLASEEYADGRDLHRKIAARKELNVEIGDLMLLYIGRPHVHKGFPVLLEAFERCFAVRTDVKLFICGCGQEDVNKVRPHMPPNVKALGYLKNLHPMYRAADAVVLPSIYEGLPYSLLEGAAQGCAMIASCIPGPDALIDEGKTGMFVEPGDVDDLVRAFHQADRNRDKLHAMGEAAYEKALTFRRENIVGPYVLFMRRILSATDSRFVEGPADDSLAV